MEENFNIHLGKKLRMRRLSLGLTQTKVAQAINVTFIACATLVCVSPNDNLRILNFLPK